jgi:DNA-binding transcriptional LysR family regulator
MTKSRERRSSIDAADAAQALQILVAVADLGSFTAAGDRLALTPSAISKAVARTETRLGVRLVQRTTRRMALTDLGEAYVAGGRRLLADLEGLEREASSGEGAVRGVLRVSAPAVYGSLKVAPQLAALQGKHPALDVQLRCDDQIIDMVAERIDVAVRMLATPPAEFVARLLDEDRRGLYASPAYLHRARLPTKVDDLAEHAIVAYSGASRAPAPWRRGRVVFATDSVLAAREAALSGIGIAELPEYLTAADVADSRLCVILPGVVPVARRIYAIYLPSRHLPPSVRACVDLLMKGAVVVRASSPVR